jgi:hypothetical protein
MSIRPTLKDAFNEAWSANAAFLNGDMKVAVLKTAMMAICQRDYIDASEQQIEIVIAECLKEMETARADFLLQTKMMR